MQLMVDDKMEMTTKTVHGHRRQSKCAKLIKLNSLMFISH